jgi:hypothetical protein
MSNSYDTLHSIKINRTIDVSSDCPFTRRSHFHYYCAKYNGWQSGVDSDHVESQLCIGMDRWLKQPTIHNVDYRRQQFLLEPRSDGRPHISLEYFPPRSREGVKVTDLFWYHLGCRWKYIGFIVVGIGHFIRPIYTWRVRIYGQFARPNCRYPKCFTNGNHALDNTLWLAVTCARVDWNNTMWFHCTNSANADISSRHDVSFLRASKTLVLSAWILSDGDVST